MKNKLIAIGVTTQNNTVLNGLSMMFQLIVDDLQEKKIPFVVLDLGKSIFKNIKEETSGTFSFFKAIDYLVLILSLLRVLIFNFNSIVYLNTAQSKVGFIRDFFIIHISSLFKCRIILHQFGSNYKGFYDSQSKFFQKVIETTLSKAEKIIVEGEYTKQQFSFLLDYNSLVICIPNGLPEKINSNFIIPKNIFSETPIKLFYLSNLIESKGYWDVLEAINLLVNTYGLNITAVFAGKFLNAVDDIKFKSADDAKDYFFKYVEHNSLKGKVTYYEGLYSERKSDEFLKAHFFLLPSYYINEGQPVSILEAMAYGCVPVVTKHRLIPMMVNESNGIFVNSKSPQEIAESIFHLIKNPKLYNNLSTNSIKDYKEKFTSSVYCNNLIHELFVN